MITVVITSRGRPWQVSGIVESAKILAKNPMGVQAIVGCDLDDPYKNNYLRLQSDYIVDMEERPTTVSMVTNRAASRVETDFLVVLGDDGVIATPHWDEILVGYLSSIKQPELRIVALNDTANQGQGTLFAMDKAWIEAVGYLLDPRFPFWFADTAITEIYSFITGRGMPIINVMVASKPAAWNPRLRDMKLWWDLFSATRDERLEIASRIRSKLGLDTPKDLATIVDTWRQRDLDGYPASEDIVRLIDNPYKPDSNYMQARRDAEDYMREYNLKTALSHQA